MKFIVKELSTSKIGMSLVILHLILTITQVIVSTLMTLFIGRTIEERTLTVILSLAAIIVADTLLGAMLKYLHKMSITHIYSALNNKYAEKLVNAPVHMFVKYSPASINTAGESMHGFVRLIDQIMGLVKCIATIILVIIAMTQISSISTVTPVIGVYIIGAVLLIITTKKLGRIDKEQASLHRSRNQELEDISIGFAEVRIFGTVKQHLKSIRSKNAEICTEYRTRTKVTSLIAALLWAIDGAALMIVILSAINRINDGVMTTAMAITLVMYVTQLTDPLAIVLNTIDTLSGELSQLSLYKEIIQFPCNNNAGSIELASFNTAIKFDNVSFTYDTTKDVLKNITMEVKKGQKIGICGVSGCGKSTIIKLLNRFYGTTGGMISIDGLNIDEITPESYCNTIGCVSQDNQIFPGTIWENLIYGSPNALESEVLDAAKRANLYELINSWPDRFNTTVGPRGITLSGGQKQRIALARLFLKNPEIVILDEATSALDNESEKLIQEAIDSLSGKTVIAVAHRLSTIQNCDVIYAMSHDGIVESGTHDELMKKGGYYAKMYNINGPV